jgi:predicted nuclease of predicted toxin-antitoxin system
MNFLIDAQLPERLKYWLIEKGFDAIHTNDLPKKHLSSDLEIINFAEKEDRIVISKDSDFYKYNLINGVPRRILFITMGNIVNRELLKLFEINFPTIEAYFNSGSKVVEFDNQSITVHE